MEKMENKNVFSDNRRENNPWLVTLVQDIFHRKSNL